MTPGYVVYLKDGSVFVTNLRGGILFDGMRNMSFDGGDHWKILGFARRHTSRRIQVSLADAADGVDLGQGWVFDLDHGTTRMWGMPKSRRAVRVLRFDDVSGFLPSRRSNPVRSSRLRHVGAHGYGGLTNWRIRTSGGVGWISVERDRDGAIYTAVWSRLNRTGTKFEEDKNFSSFAKAKAWLLSKAGRS